MLWCGLAFFILVWVLCFFLNAEAFDRYLVFEALEAYSKGITRGKGAIHWIVDERQVSIAVSALDLIKHPRVLMSFQACAKALKLGALQALCFSLLCLVFLGIYAYRSRQRQKSRDFTEMQRHPEEVLKAREPSVADEDPDRSHPACAVASELCKTLEK